MYVCTYVYIVALLSATALFAGCPEGGAWEGLYGSSHCGGVGPRPQGPSSPSWSQGECSPPSPVLAPSGTSVVCYALSFLQEFRGRERYRDDDDRRGKPSPLSLSSVHAVMSPPLPR